MSAISAPNQVFCSLRRSSEHIPFSKLRLSEEENAKVQKVAKAVGCVLTDDGQPNGSALLISKNYVLVPKHCFPFSEGKIRFSSRPAITATTFIDGELEPAEGLRADFKILHINDTVDVAPPELAVSQPVGRSVQINYQVDGELYASTYESEGDCKGDAMRSDLANVITINGDSGGIRMSLTRPFAIHSIHQGESEALKINDIYHALLSIKGEKSQTILSELDASIVDKEMLHIHASTVALRVDSVIPERHGTLQSAKISEEPISPIPKRVIQDIFDFIDNFSSGAKVDFFAKMFGSIKTLYDRQFSTHQKHGTRLDIQSPTKDAANLQIQVGDQTIATVLVDLHLREYGKEHAPRQCEVSNYVLRKLRGGVNYAHTSHQAAVIKVSPLKTLGDTNEFKPSGHD